MIVNEKPITREEILKTLVETKRCDRCHKPDKVCFNGKCYECLKEDDAMNEK